MGRGRRPRPNKLHKKLAETRRRLEITQEEMAKRLIKLGAERTTSSGMLHCLDFETGKREPSLLVILAYSRLLGLSTDVLIDDRRNLP